MKQVVKIDEAVQHRQGDVGVDPIAELPKNLKPRKDMAVAYGEVTGHAHKFRAVGEPDTVEVLEDERGSVYVNVKGELGAYLHHGTDEQIKQQQVDPNFDYVAEDNHEPQYFAPGCYKVINQVEYDPYEAAMRKVLD